MDKPTHVKSGVILLRPMAHFYSGVDMLAALAAEGVSAVAVPNFLAVGGSERVKALMAVLADLLV